MGRSDRVYLAVWGGERPKILASAVLGDASGAGECDVCLYLAFFRQSRFPGVAGDASGQYDGGGKLHPDGGGLVDLPIGADPR